MIRQAMQIPVHRPMSPLTASEKRNQRVIVSVVMPLKSANVKRQARKRRTSQRCKPTLSVPLYILYREERSGGDICEGEEDSEWPNHDPTNVVVTFQSLHRTAAGTGRFFYDAIEVIPDVAAQTSLCLAVVRYSTGDTFGRTNGMWSVVGAYPTVTLAETALSQALDPANSQHKPWEGYFERVEQTEVHVVPVMQ